LTRKTYIWFLRLTQWGNMKLRSQRFTLDTNSYGKYYFIFHIFRIIKMFLDGKSFPTGVLPIDKQRQHVYDVVNFITNEQFLKELLEFDTE
jgi:hypothetical protein